MLFLSPKLSSSRDGEIIEAYLHVYDNSGKPANKNVLLPLATGSSKRLRFQKWPYVYFKSEISKKKGIKCNQLL